MKSEPEIILAVELQKRIASFDPSNCIGSSDHKKGCAHDCVTVREVALALNDRAEVRVYQEEIGRLQYKLKSVVKEIERLVAVWNSANTATDVGIREIDTAVGNVQRAIGES